jgi:hypothetical protein
VNLGIDPKTVLLFFSSSLFGFWPLILLLYLLRKGRSLPSMSLVWSLLGVVRLILVFPHEAGFRFIQEPLNSYLFLLTGLALVMIWILRWIVGPRLFSRKYRRIRDLERLQSLSSSDFERMVVALFRSQGHKARQVGGQGDHGLDVLVAANNGQKWIVQCKKWKGSVGEPAIRDLFGVLHHEEADKAALITAGSFTNQARVWAQGKPIELIDGVDFLRLWRKTRHKLRR